MSSSTYPVRVDAQLDDQLSRCLWLVKWALAIPHFILLGFLGVAFLVLSVIAHFAILFTGRYPRSIFDLALGLNRRALRVAAYVSFMTDAYPPFRLDLGGSDPATGVLALGTPPDMTPAGQTPGTPTPATPTPATPTTPPPTGPPPTAPGPGGGGRPTPPPATHWGAGRIIAVVIGSMMAMTALGLLSGGLALKIGDSVLRDDDGYLMSSTQRYDSPGLAVTSENVDLNSDSANFNLASRWLGTVKVEAESRTADSVFVGIARTSDVDAYLRGVAHTVVTDPSGDHGDPETQYVPGDRPTLRPADESFWVTSAQGTGQQVVTWEPKDGDWTIVVMNAEGTAPVRADVAAGAEVPIVDNVAIGLMASGTVLLAFAVLVLVLAIRRRRTP